MLTAVTGASGHIGANLIRELLRQNRAVRVCIYHDTRAIQGLDVESIKADILNIDSLKKAFYNVDIVYHLAACISLSRKQRALMYRINVQGTNNVINACKATGVHRLVYFSSIHAFSSQPRQEIIDEKRALVKKASIMAYDLTKAEGEHLILKAVSDGLDAVIVNPTGVIGPCDFKPSFLGNFLIALYMRRIPLLVEGGFNWVDVRDVITGALSAEKYGKSGERYILSGHWHSIKGLCKIIQDVTARRMPRYAVPPWLAQTATPFICFLSRRLGKTALFTRESIYTLQHHRYISHRKATEILGYKPRALSRTIRDTFNWFQKHGYIK